MHYGNVFGSSTNEGVADEGIGLVLQDTPIKGAYGQPSSSFSSEKLDLSASAGRTTDIEKTPGNIQNTPSNDSKHHHKKCSIHDQTFVYRYPNLCCTNPRSCLEVYCFL